MTERKFHRYVYRYEVLSEDPLDWDPSLEGLSNLTFADYAYVAIDDGGLMLVLADNPDVYLEVGGVPRKLSPQDIFARQLFESACTMNRAAAEQIRKGK